MDQKNSGCLYEVEKGTILRILFCNYEYPPLGGGGGVVNAYLAQELAKRHEVTVLTSQGLGLPQEASENGVRVVRVPVVFRKQEASANLLSMLMFLPMGIARGKKLLATNKFDILNTHFVLPTGPVGQALARYGQIPNILSVHGGDLFDPSKFTSPHRHVILRLWVRHLLKRADTVVGQSKNTLENVGRFYTREVQPVRIPLGIPKPQLDGAHREAHGFSKDEVLFTTVGRLVARKGIPQLLEMMEGFRGEKVRLVIIGSGPQEHSLKEECSKRQVSSQVAFMGFVKEEEKFRLLQISDAYVSTSQHEGFGLVFLEAMACGLPIVCYDHGGQTDFLSDRENGFVVPLNNLAVFAEKSRMIACDGELRKSIGERNRRSVEEYFIERCGEKYEALFQEAVQRHVGQG